MSARHLAIDIGASSGRHIVGEVVDGKMQLTEVYRFENRLVQKNGHLCWDIDALFQSVLAGLAAAREQGLTPDTIGIDTWAVDFVLLDADGSRLGDAVGYRDSRTDGIREELERNRALSFAEQYARAAIKQSFDIKEVLPLMLVETKAKVGVFSIALGAYLPQFPQLVPEFESQYADFKASLPTSVEVVDGGMVTTKEAAAAAGDKFRAADVDLVFMQLLTYATSYNMLPAIRDLNVPVVLVNLQKVRCLDFATAGTAAWLGIGYAGGTVGEMVADLNRAGKRHAVITGVQGDDPEVKAQIEDWCRAAQVRRRFRNTNLAQIGRSYPGMMDLYIDETNLYNRMGVYTKQFDWEKMWAIADDVTDEATIAAEVAQIHDTFDILGEYDEKDIHEMARYVLAFEQWVRDENLGFVASHYDGFAQGKAGVLDSMLIPAFSMLIKQGVACAVEGDIKVLASHVTEERFPSGIFSGRAKQRCIRFSGCSAFQVCTGILARGAAGVPAAAAPPGPVAPRRPTSPCLRTCQSPRRCPRGASQSPPGCACGRTASSGTPS